MYSYRIYCKPSPCCNPLKTSENLWFFNVFRSYSGDHWHEMGWAIFQLLQFTVFLILVSIAFKNIIRITLLNNFCWSRGLSTSVLFYGLSEFFVT